MTATPTYTLDELRSSLRKSNIVSLITEGRDDYTLFRNILTPANFVDCLPAGGKKAVLDLHDNHADFGCPRIAFLADRDLWALDGNPHWYESSNKLVLTDGYSIENDLLRDTDVERLLTDQEMEKYRADLQDVIRWFCAGVLARQSGVDFNFQRRISHIIESPGKGLTLSAKSDVSTWLSGEALVDKVASDYQKFLRGKTWLSLLSLYLDADKRGIRHSKMALLDIGLRSRGPFSTRIKEELGAILAVPF